MVKISDNYSWDDLEGRVNSNTVIDPADQLDAGTEQGRVTALYDRLSRSVREFTGGLDDDLEQVKADAKKQQELTRWGRFTYKFGTKFTRHNPQKREKAQRRRSLTYLDDLQTIHKEYKTVEKSFRGRLETLQKRGIELKDIVGEANTKYDGQAEEYRLDLEAYDKVVQKNGKDAADLQFGEHLKIAKDDLEEAAKRVERIKDEVQFAQARLQDDVTFYKTLLTEVTKKAEEANERYKLTKDEVERTNYSRPLLERLMQANVRTEVIHDATTSLQEYRQHLEVSIFEAFEQGGSNFKAFLERPVRTVEDIKKIVGHVKNIESMRITGRDSAQTAANKALTAWTNELDSMHRALPARGESSGGSDNDSSPKRNRPLTMREQLRAEAASSDNEQ